jgi:hypothetical protein
VQNLGRHILEHPSCGDFMPTAETTRIPASGINQRNARLDNEPISVVGTRRGRSIQSVDLNTAELAEAL